MGGEADLFAVRKFLAGEQDFPLFRSVRTFLVKYLLTLPRAREPEEAVEK
jgi:hypothetical protein